MKKYKIEKKDSSIYPYYISLYRLTDVSKRRSFFKIFSFASLLLLIVPNVFVKFVAVCIGLVALSAWVIDRIILEDYEYIGSFDSDEELHTYIAELEFKKDIDNNKVETFYL